MHDLKLRVGPTRIYYPDVFTVCTPRADDGRVAVGGASLFRGYWPAREETVELVTEDLGEGAVATDNLPVGKIGRGRHREERLRPRASRGRPARRS